MLEFLSHNCKEKASFFLIVFFNLLILCQKLLIQRYTCNQLKHTLPQFNHSSHINFIAMLQKSNLIKIIKELPTDVSIFSARVIHSTKKNICWHTRS
ncbi:hypothetical protein X973_06695 [Piscirickettsia salmonis]|nr:hypothetical protein X973_06695 [Piscirickettsia salmonis]WGZ71732.1 hypothetical protein E3220_08890 [Piscirickettsia salmonis EM-90]